MVQIVDTDAARALVDAGAQVIEVLPRSAWQQEHLPGAVSIPLPELRVDRLGELDPSAPTVVYCYDHECDLSARAAALLERLGFTAVHDYADSKTAWLGEGLPSEGDVPASDRAGARAKPVATCSDDATVGEVAGALQEGDATVVVVLAGDVVVGAVHPSAAGLPPGTRVLDVADPGPPTVRPSVTRFELARSMDEQGQRQVIVSTSGGRLVGLVRRTDLD